MQRHARVFPIIVLSLATSSTPGIHPAIGQHTNLPPAALALAHRLHFTGLPFVGSQRQGNFGPWLIWGKPDLYSSRRILSVGPAGARGRFDYFVPSALPQRGGRASAPPVSTRKALQIARAWLTRAGVATPLGHIVIFHTHTTTIGGTGLCCWRNSLDVVIFGGVASIYVAPSQQIVQVNFRPRGRYPGTLRCHNQAHPDNRAVPVGVVCFSYSEITSLMWKVTLGGHQPYLDGPGWFSQVAASHAKMASPPYKVHLRPVSVGPYRAVYTVSKRAITYRFTQVPAFPDLSRSSIWPLVEVRRIS